jgi:hypothetical protein
MRPKRLSLCLALLWLIGSTGQAHAVLGTIDKVPAATLLLPYFEVDVNNSSGMNTLFAIGNTAPAAVLAHVTIWTDQSIPALNFDLYLTGYDVQTISLRDIFVNGNLPVTASAGQDPKDSISPKGQLSQDINFASCSGKLPYVPGAVSASFRAHLQAWLQGNQSPATGNCAGSKKKDGILRGYVTVDTVNDCNSFSPADWAHYSAFITNQNVLWGDVTYVNPAQFLYVGGDLVHLEACVSAPPPSEGIRQPGCFLPGDHTFYGRYNGASAADMREPLPFSVGARYGRTQPANPPPSLTLLYVWREGNAAASGYNCALQGPPSWYPLKSAASIIFDEQEQAVMINEDCVPGDPTCSQTILIPNEAQKVDTVSDLLSPFNFGWVMLDLRGDPATSAYGDNLSQMWLTNRLGVTGVILGMP